MWYMFDLSVVSFVLSIESIYFLIGAHKQQVWFLYFGEYNVMGSCVCMWERETISACVVLSQLCFLPCSSQPCEACRENVSHGVIMTNLPRPQPPISSTIFLHSISMPCHPRLCFFSICPSESCFSYFIALLNLAAQKLLGLEQLRIIANVMV